MSSTPATKQKTFEQFLSERPGATTEEWQRWNVSEANTKGKEDMAARERLSQSRDQAEKPVKRSTAKSEL